MAYAGFLSQRMVFSNHFTSLWVTIFLSQFVYLAGAQFYGKRLLVGAKSSTAFPSL
jgi:hypothetical protein